MTWFKMLKENLVQFLSFFFFLSFLWWQLQEQNTEDANQAKSYKWGWSTLFTHREIKWVRYKVNKKRKLCKMGSEVWEEGEEPVSRTLKTLTVHWLWVFVRTLQQKLEGMLFDRFVGDCAWKCAGNAIRLREKSAR